MTNDAVRAIRNVVLLGASVASLAMCRSCPFDRQQPPSITCSDFTVVVRPGTCTQIQNPCSAGGWKNPPRLDGFCLEGEPSSIVVRTDRIDGVTTRSICDVSGASGSVVGQSLVFVYGLGAAYGTGHVTLTVSTQPIIAISATPETIDLGQGSQLVANVTGGVPPYSYNWVPTTGLNTTNIPTPQASPGVTTEYTVSVTDSAGESVTATVPVRVRMQLNVTANPTAIDAGDISQLNASGGGGRTPYAFAWTHAASLNDPSIANPIASPALTTVYTVVWTDADHVTLTGSVEVTVNLVIIGLSATPATVESGASAQLDVQYEGGDGTYAYAWSPAAGLNNASIRNPVATPGASTTYTVTITDGHGQSATASVPVTVNAASPPPTPAFSYNVTCCPPTLTLDATGSSGAIASYTWDLSWTAASPDLVTTSPSASFPMAEGDRGTITLTVTTAGGQSSSVSRSFPR